VGVFALAVSNLASVRNTTEPHAAEPTVATLACPLEEREEQMNTLIDVVVLLIAYAGLSSVCSILLHLLSSSPTRGNRDAETTRGW
jgi:hypothetical protein